MLRESLQKLAALTSHSQIVDPIFSVPPFSLGIPSENAQSMYYPGDGQLSQSEVSFVSGVLEQRGIYPENTRITKHIVDGKATYHVLQASSQIGNKLRFEVEDKDIILKSGDHDQELSKICRELKEALKYANNSTQKQFLEQYIKSFETGDLEYYKKSQRAWVRDHNPRVENIFGFVEPYRDPFGARAEFEGLVAISDPEETKALTELVHHSETFIRRLPWAVGRAENNGKGPFEKSLFEPPGFTSIHGEQLVPSLEIAVEIILNSFTALAYCSSIIFPGINLPNVSCTFRRTPKLIH